MLKLRIGVAICALLWSACSGCSDDSGGGSKTDASVPTAEVTLTVLNDDARSCEVMLHEKAWEVTGVSYEEGISGDWESWAPRVALAFAGGKDEALDRVLKLTLRRKAAEGEPEDFEKIETTCFDRTGKVLEGADVRVE